MSEPVSAGLRNRVPSERIDVIICVCIHPTDGTRQTKQGQQPEEG